MFEKDDHRTQLSELENVYTQPESRYDDDSFADPDGNSNYSKADFKKDENHEFNFQANTEYIPLTGSNSEFSKPLPVRYNTKTVWLSLLSLAWCAAAIALLYLNISAKDIGGSAWCPSGSCSGIPFRNATQSPAQVQAGFEKMSRDLNGALQFVAKAMEVWFVFIAGELVWLMTISLARTEQGLPLIYLLTYVEFADMLKLLDPKLWKAYQATDQRQHRVKIIFFVAIVALSGILCNLMGPSVAVLVIPTIQYRESAQVFDTRFEGWLSSEAPSTLPGCDATGIRAKNFSCTRGLHSYALDSLSNFIAAQTVQNDQRPKGWSLRNNVPASTQEWLLSMRFNNSAGGSDPNGIKSLWAPNRQVVQQLSKDVENYHNSSGDRNSYYGRHSNSLDLILQRQGPVIGFRSSETYGPLRITTITPNKSIRCHPFYVDDQLPLAKCFQEGSGWQNGTQNGTSALFFNTNSLNGKTGFETAAYYSNRATIVNSTFRGNDYDPCFPDGQLNDTQECDYDSLFSGQFPTDIKLPEDVTADLFGDLSNAFVVEQYSATNKTLTFIQEAWFKSGIALYSTQISNASFSSTFGEVDIDEFPTDLQSVRIDPSWFLAAWSVDNQGSVDPSRSSSQILQRNFDRIYERMGGSASDSDIVKAWNSYPAFYWSQINRNALMHMASTLTWTATDVSRMATSDKDTLLYNSARRRVWTFGLFSRTSYLGISVVFCGIALALVKICMAAVIQSDCPPSSSVLAAALRQGAPVTMIPMSQEKDVLKTTRIAIHENKHGQLDLQRK